MIELFYKDIVLWYDFPLCFTLSDCLSENGNEWVAVFDEEVDGKLSYLVFKNTGFPFTLDNIEDDLIDSIKAGNYGAYYTWIDEDELYDTITIETT